MESEEKRAIGLRKTYKVHILWYALLSIRKTTWIVEKKTIPVQRRHGPKSQVKELEKKDTALLYA
jgi:hypothetical protein